MFGSHPARSLALSLFLALGAAPSLGCTHGGTASSPAAQSITVVGRGEVRARPDLARVSLGVETRAATVAEANRLTNERIAAVIAAVRGVGIAEADVRTSNYSISFERSYPPDGYPPPMPFGAPHGAMDMPAADAVASAAAPAIASAAPRGAGKAPPPPPAPSASAVRPMPPGPPGPGVMPAGVYRVANTVEITIRDVAKVALVLDGAVATGANEVQGVFFDIDDRKPHEARVREAAVADARTRADALAQLHGKKRGALIAVSEVVTDVGHPVFAPMAMSARDASGGAQIAPGELTVGGQVQVIYAFED